MAKTITFPLTDELHRDLKNYCIQEGMTIRETLELAINKLLKEKKEQNIEQKVNPENDAQG